MTIVRARSGAGALVIATILSSCTSPRQYDPQKSGIGGAAGVVASGGGVLGSAGTTGITGGASGTGGIVATSGGGTVEPGGGGIGGVGGSGSAGARGSGGGASGCGDSLHNCAGTCVSNNSVEHCGPLCDSCTGPANGVPTCDGNKCDFTCGGSMKKCGSKCIGGCCADSDCPPQSGKAGQCDTSTNACSYSCAAGFKPCGAGNCIPMGACCADSDCPGTCKACSGGSCATVTNADDSDSCPGTCDGTGACKAKQGQTCQTGSGCVAGTTCAPDGYCCNSPCTSSCQACDIPGFLGVCTSVASGPPHGNRVLCTGVGTACGGVCANKPDGTCSYPSSATACGGAKACTSGTTAGGGACNGGGQCASPATMSCPNGCNTAGTDCLVCGAGSVACNGLCCSVGQSCCGGGCVDTNSNPAMCGSSCTVCSAPNRATPTCTSGMCGTSCIGGAPKCSDGSCSRLSWTFDSTDLDGVAATAGATTFAVRTLGGNMALAVDATNLTNVNVVVPVCHTGFVDLGTKTLSFRAYFDGTPSYRTASP